MTNSNINTISRTGQLTCHLMSNIYNNWFECVENRIKAEVTEVSPLQDYETPESLERFGGIGNFKAIVVLTTGLLDCETNLLLTVAFNMAKVIETTVITDCQSYCFGDWSTVLHDCVAGVNLCDAVTMGEYNLNPHDFAVDYTLNFYRSGWDIEPAEVERVSISRDNGIVTGCHIETCTDKYDFTFVPDFVKDKIDGRQPDRTEITNTYDF